MLSRDLVLPNLLARRATERPDDVFLRHVDGEQLTFADVHMLALRWATTLRELGVSPGDRVLVMLPPSFTAITVWLGAAWLRAIEVPVHTAYRAGILEYTVSNADATVAVIGTEFRDRFDEIDMPNGLRIVEVGDSPAQLAELATDLEAPEAHDISSILYTSGTTGPSKGVLVPWAQAHATATGCIPLHDMDQRDIWYSPYPLHHASGKIPVYAMALLGGTVVIRERFVGRKFWDDILRFRVTTTMMIGASASYIAERKRVLGTTDSTLRNVLVSPPPADPPEFEREFGIRICSVFNMTEISAPISTEWRPMLDRTCGGVRAGYECRIVDEHDRELPDGTPGELVVRSDQPWLLTPGYWRKPEKTAEVWRNGWFHTGDVCLRRADGEFFFIDRLKDAIRRRGENISSMEVEAAVIEHPLVHDCAAFGVPAEFGEEEVKIAVVVDANAAFEPDDLVDFLVAKLPKFMVPRYVEVLDELPRTPTEKIRKTELRTAGVTPQTWDRDA